MPFLLSAITVTDYQTQNLKRYNAVLGGQTASRVSLHHYNRESRYNALTSKTAYSILLLD